MDNDVIRVVMEELAIAPDGQRGLTGRNPCENQPSHARQTPTLSRAL